MLGAIYGDIIGSYYESHSTKNYHFDLFPSGARFTDDTVLTAAVCDAILYSDRKAGDFFDRGSVQKNMHIDTNNILPDIRMPALAIYFVNGL